jgi:hypothetical protein
MAAHPDPARVLCALAEKIRQASWSPRFANGTEARQDVLAAMRESEAVLPPDESRGCWKAISSLLEEASNIRDA